MKSQGTSRNSSFQSAEGTIKRVSGCEKGDCPFEERGLLYDLDLRRAEVVGLDVEDLDLAAGTVAVLGTTASWVVVYVVLSIALMLALRRPLGVTM